GGDHGLVLAPSAVVALVEHARLQLLRRGARRGTRRLRQTGDLQHGPGGTVHRGRLHPAAARPRHRHQHGWEGSLPGQRLRGAPLALAQVRGGLPPRLRQRRTSPRRHRPLLRLLQRRALAPGAWIPDTGGLPHRRREKGGVMRDLHSLVHNLPVSPLALPPPALRIERTVSRDDCETLVTEKRLRIHYMYDTEYQRRAGSTLFAGLDGPKKGVHLTP